MKKKDILELKKRFKKDDCTFTKMCGCYVDGEKNMVLKFNETFLSLEEEEFFKYLEIAKKVLSGTIGNNILELEFPYAEEADGGRQYELMKLKRSQLKDEDLLNNFYEKVIESYDYTGNFLILLFHDAYDVIIKTTDNSKLDESEEVYEYILCAICPVSLSKPGLGYFEDDNRIGARIRDWVVELPANGFVFPAFSNRSADVNSIMYYTKNAKDTHPEFMEEVLGCPSKQTATEQKEVFTNIIKNAIGTDDEKSNKLLMEIQDNLNTMVDDYKSVNDKDSEPIVLTNNAITDILVESGIPKDITSKIEKCYTQEFGDTPPVAEHLLDSKLLAAKEQKKKEEKLQKQIEVLQNKLEITMKNKSDEENNNEHIDLENNTEPDDLSHNENINKQSENINEAAADNAYDIVLQVKPEKVNQIKSQIIDGKKYLVIPVDDDEQANVNGVTTLL